MAKSISLNINAKDNASAEIGRIGKSVQGLGTIAKGMVALFAVDKIAEFFTSAADFASEADSGVSKSLKGMKDTFAGLQVTVVKNIVGNKDFMNSIKTLMDVLAPMIVQLVTGLVPVLTLAAQGAADFARVVGKVLGPVLRVVKEIFMQAGLAVKMFWQLLKGDTQGAKESFQQLTDFETRIQRIKDAFNGIGDAAPVAVPNLQAVGARANANIAAAGNKPTDPNEARDKQFETLIKLREAGLATQQQLQQLTATEAQYRAELTNTTTKAERRLQVNDLLTQSGKFAEEQQAAWNKELDEYRKQQDAARKADDERLSALVSLANAGKATTTDLAELNRQLADYQMLAQNANDPTLRASAEQQIQTLQGAIRAQKDSALSETQRFAQDLEQQLGDQFGAALFNGFSAALETGRITSLFGTFFGSAMQSISQGMTAMTIRWMKENGAFMAFQGKIYAAYGKLMAGLAKFLGNPFTAGVAALAIAAGIGALSRSLGAQASGGGGGVGLPVGGIGLGNTTNVANNAGGVLNVFVDGGIVNLNDPRQRQQWQDVFRDSAGRNINVFSR